MNMNKPLVKAHLFADHGCGCALIGADPEAGDVEVEPIAYDPATPEDKGVEGEAADQAHQQWHQAAFLACTIAYRRLQARNPDKDVVCTLDLPAHWPSGQRS